MTRVIQATSSLLLSHQTTLDLSSFDVVLLSFRPYSMDYPMERVYELSSESSRRYSVRGDTSRPFASPPSIFNASNSLRLSPPE